MLKEAGAVDLYVVSDVHLHTRHGDVVKCLGTNDVNCMCLEEKYHEGNRMMK
jgi:hypothetical protein